MNRSVCLYIVSRTHWRKYETAKRQKRVAMTCPECGMEVCLMGSVFSKHEVRKQGRVLPIVDCPGDSCGFRGSCVLDGWEDDTVRD